MRSCTTYFGVSDNVSHMREVASLLGYDPNSLRWSKDVNRERSKQTLTDVLVQWGVTLVV